MAVKTFQTRIKHKLDTNTNFTNFVPLSGELVVGKSTNNNLIGSPYIAKIGDGTSAYQNLPVLGQFPFIGSSIDSDHINLSNEELTLTLKFEDNIKNYIVQDINTNNDVSYVILSINENSIPMFTEHYVLLVNNGNSDVLFNGIKCQGLFGNDNIKIYTKCDYIRAGETCEIPIKIFTINNEVYIVAIPNYSTGQDYGIVSNDGIWYVNKNLNIQ